MMESQLFLLLGTDCKTEIEWHATSGSGEFLLALWAQNGVKWRKMKTGVAMHNGHT